MIDLKYLQDTINPGWLPFVVLKEGLNIGDIYKIEAGFYFSEQEWLVMQILDRDRGLYRALPLSKKKDVK